LVLALVWWLFSTYVLPRVPEPFRTVIIVVLVVAVCLWLLSLVGILGPLNWHLRN
jgi:CHASE2 domain-containing sensor protein